MVREMQNYIPGREKDEIIQDVASKSAMSLLADPRFASNTSFQRELRESTGIKRTNTIKYRHLDGSVQPLSYFSWD
jgi:hypothetical protein